MAQPIFAGIDVSKERRLDVALGNQFFSIKHTEEEMSHLVEKLKAASPQLIVLEASGARARRRSFPHLARKPLSE